MRLDRVAGAPISWGVCEVPGWGHQLEPATVLTQMRELGLAASEFGPTGFLPDDPADKAATLASYDLRAVGGFLPVVLHEDRHDPLPEVDAYIDACRAAGADVIVLAAATGTDGYDTRPVLDESQWQTMLTALDRLTAHATSRGVAVAVHPHMGTMIESREDVLRMLAGSVASLCVDTGHLLVGGTDPVALVDEHADRVAHVHLKDVDGDLAARVRAGTLAFGAAVQAGLFLPFGKGVVDIEAIVQWLESSGYTGWYVLEQDVMLATADAEGPHADVARCLDYLRAVDA